MLTSILNLTSGQKQDSTEIAGSTIISSGQQMGDNEQNQPTSNSPFAQQLTQFRQLMQGLPATTGKILPELSDAESIKDQLTSQFSNLERFISQLEQQQDLTDVELTNEFTNNSVAGLDSLQQLLDSIGANLQQLGSIANQAEPLLNDQQIVKLDNAIAVLQSSLDNVNNLLSGEGTKPLEPFALKQAVGDLLESSMVALKRVNVALAQNQKHDNSADPTKLSPNQDLMLKPAEQSSVQEKANYSAKQVVEMVDTKQQNKAKQIQAAQLFNKTDADGVKESKLKLSLNNSTNSTPAVNGGAIAVDGKFVPDQSILNSTNKQDIESNNFTQKQLLELAALSKGVGSSVNQPELISLQSARRASNTGLDPVAAVLPTVIENISGSNISTAQLTSNSNIQQGLALRSDFSPNLALRIQWIFQQALSSAEIMMDPPELGPLSVKMQHRGGETNIVFHVNNQQTKEMIEENLAKLKELLQEQGITLGDTQVKQNNQQNNEPQSESALMVDSDELNDAEEQLEANVVSESGRVAILDAYI